VPYRGGLTDMIFTMQSVLGEYFIKNRQAFERLVNLNALIGSAVVFQAVDEATNLEAECLACGVHRRYEMMNM
jgi:hypothetical protein